jgi:hypothetical protein
MLGRVSNLYLDIESESKLAPIDEQPDDDIMHLNRFGKPPIKRLLSRGKTSPFHNF